MKVSISRTILGEWDGVQYTLDGVGTTHATKISKKTVKKWRKALKRYGKAQEQMGTLWLALDEEYREESMRRWVEAGGKPENSTNALMVKAYEALINFSLKAQPLHRDL